MDHCISNLEKYYYFALLWYAFVTDSAGRLFRLTLWGTQQQTPLTARHDMTRHNSVRCTASKFPHLLSPVKFMQKSSSFSSSFFIDSSRFFWTGVHFRRFFWIMFLHWQCEVYNLKVPTPPESKSLTEVQRWVGSHVCTQQEGVGRRQWMLIKIVKNQVVFQWVLDFKSLELGFNRSDFDVSPLIWIVLVSFVCTKKFIQVLWLEVPQNFAENRRTIWPTSDGPIFKISFLYER